MSDCLVGRVFAWICPGGDVPPNSADTQTCNYAHDDFVRIASANCGAAASQTFSYDPFGNISTSGSPYSFQASYSNTTNHITCIGGSGQNCTGGVIPTYDANGNTTMDSLHTYAWDADGNSITMDSVSVTYDALDRAVEQNRSGSYTEMVYAPAGGKLALMNGQTLLTAFVPLPGGATAVYASAGLAHYRHSDWLGSARLTSSPSQTYLSSTAYTPFGDTYASSGTPDPSFTGQNSDTVSTDYDFLFRTFSTTGRWASPDPAGLAAVDPSNPQSWNRYAYALNNPLAFIDLFGLDCAFLNDAGDEVAEWDNELDQSACDDQGGVYFDGSIDPNSLQFDPNSDYVFALGTAGNSQFSCPPGGACDPNALGDFSNSIFGQSSAQVNAPPGSLLSFIFSPSQPLYVPNDVPLNANARIILGTVDKTTRSLGNPCTVAAFYGSSASAAVSFGTTEPGAALFPELNQTMQTLKATPFFRKVLPYLAAGSAAAKFVGAFDKAKNAAQKACDAMQ